MPMTFTKVTYCDVGQNFTFIQMTPQGLKSVTIPIDAVDEKKLFKAGNNWAGVVKPLYISSFEDDATHFISSRSTNSATLPQAKIEISAIKSEYVEIYDLVMEEDKQGEPDDYMSYSGI